jgi:hypothetical protein
MTAAGGIGAIGSDCAGRCCEASGSWRRPAVGPPTAIAIAIANVERSTSNLLGFRQAGTWPFAGALSTGTGVECDAVRIRGILGSGMNGTRERKKGYGGGALPR